MRTVQLKDPDVQRFQANAQAALAPIEASGIVSGRLVTFTATAPIQAGSDFTVSHGIGQVPTAILPALSAIFGLFYSSPSSNPNPKQIMILRCSGNIVTGQSAQFWVW